MKKVFLLIAVATNIAACAQQLSSAINVSEVHRIESVLASDAMRGRRAGTPDIDRAADFIASEFKKAGLQPLQGNSFLQEFFMVRPQLKNVKASLNDEDFDPSKVIAITTEGELKVDEKSGYEVQYIKASDDFRNRLQQITSNQKNTVVFVDTAFAKLFPRLRSYQRPTFKAAGAAASNIIFVLSAQQPKSFKFKIENNIHEVKYANVVGILPGKSRKQEYVIFSGHYDHLGVGRPVNGDSIYNGANDDAAGTTAVIMLANYFKKLNNNERTLVFAAFTAEEVGGFGSQYFSRQFNPEKVVAMFNIEMIGTESEWGKNAAYITGFEKTDMGTILQKNLNGTSFTFHPDPYTKENLFYRSDNATLARLGVPAHTISTAKMEDEPNYHKVSDEIETLDMENMAKIIEAIAVSAKSIISGKDTPTRVQQEDLR